MIMVPAQVCHHGPETAQVLAASAHAAQVVNNMVGLSQELSHAMIRYP